MPAKKPAPKAAKGKKAASRPPAHKSAVARKPEERVKAVAAAQVRQSAVAPKKAVPQRSTPTTEETTEMRKAAEPVPETPENPAPGTSNQILVHPRASAALQAAADADDGDSVEPGSLLAGPRNVQPYIVKRGELYMGKPQLEHFRQILESWKRDLMEEVDRTVSHMKDEAANFPDPNDRATQEEEFSLELRTRDRERKLIRKID